MAFPAGLIDLIQILSQCGVEDAIICPGSRNAPIMLALTRNPKINCYSISDERSAGFFALGIALKTKKPVIICCTSGSAALNFAPAIVEAFFQEVPLIVLTADRPPEWIGQWDGQTIYQQNLYGNHVKFYSEFSTRMSNDRNLPQLTYQISVEEPKGPVHLNIPISEPFYPQKEDHLVAENFYSFTTMNPKIDLLNDEESFFIQETIQGANRILLTVGQMDEDPFVTEGLLELHRSGITIVGDATANLPNEILIHHDLILANEKNWPRLKPDVHIHLGKSFVSKRIKLFLRQQNPEHSWLAHPKPIRKPDPFQSLTRLFPVDASEMLSAIIQAKPKSQEYFNTWMNLGREVVHKQSIFFESDNWSELRIFEALLNRLNKEKLELHVANSLSVRYLNWTKTKFSAGVIWANRGTSCIDGCLSTAVGASQKSDGLVISVLGDVAFHYDKNALWNQYIPSNLRIIVFNNQGGGIFRNLEGAKDLPELSEFMETKQSLTAKNTADDAGLTYFSVDHFEALPAVLDKFLDLQMGACLVEIHTNSIQNAQVLQSYMALFKD